MRNRAVFLDYGQSTVVVPEFVAAVFAAGEDEVVVGTPVHLEHQSLVGLPLQVFLLVGRNGLQRDELVEAVKQCVALRTPRH